MWRSNGFLFHIIEARQATDGTAINQTEHVKLSKKSKTCIAVGLVLIAALVVTVVVAVKVLHGDGDSGSSGKSNSNENEPGKDWINYFIYAFYPCLSGY